ncbi:MAG: HEPN domain-containing protein [Elusimicrobia bacterium]|nr:HEPN domain-containing protein [Elusimicrobiota bacterium]
MRPDPKFAGTPRDWLRRAKSNLARAKQSKPAGAVWEDLCFDAQQAAEKAIKAVLVLLGVGFPKTHDIRELLGLAGQADLDIPQEVQDAMDLTDYAVATRYPSAAEPVTREEYGQAVGMAELVVQWAERTIKSRRKR